jgi:hypothetical protein
MKTRDLLAAGFMLGVGVLFTWMVAGTLESRAGAANAAAASASEDVASHQTVPKRF